MVKSKGGDRKGLRVYIKCKAGDRELSDSARGTQKGVWLLVPGKAAVV